MYFVCLLLLFFVLFCLFVVVFCCCFLLGFFFGGGGFGGLGVPVRGFICHSRVKRGGGGGVGGALIPGYFYGIRAALDSVHRVIHGDYYF